MTEERIERYIRALGFELSDFEKTRKNVRKILKQLENRARVREPKGPPKPRRNVYKVISKEVRVIRILRKKMGLTQYQASSKCGYVNSIFGQIENGRIELPRERIEYIVRCLGVHVSEFDRLIQTEFLRDEMIEQCTRYLEELEDQKLDSARTAIMALMK